jgi:hypothetical protein
MMPLPWWAFLMMPLMMLGMGAMMWLMMRMMMGMDHGSHQGPARQGSGQPLAESESEVEALRWQVAELQERLTAMEAKSEHDGSAPKEGEDS